MENKTDIILNLQISEKQTKNCLQTKLRLDNCLFPQKQQKKFLLKLKNIKICVIVIVICVIDLNFCKSNKYYQKKSRV